MPFGLVWLSLVVALVAALDALFSRWLVWNQTQNAHNMARLYPYKANRDSLYNVWPAFTQHRLSTSAGMAGGRLTHSFPVFSRSSEPNLLGKLG